MFLKIIKKNSFILYSSLIFITISVFLLFLHKDALYLFKNGDIAQYCSFISHRNLLQLSIHIGYYMIGILFNSISIFPVINTMNILNVIFSAGSVVMCLLITHYFNENKNSFYALLGCFALLTNHTFQINTSLSEIYMCQSFLNLLTLFLFLKGYYFISGIIFFLSVLVSTNSILYLLMFFLSMKAWEKRIKFSIPLIIGISLFIILLKEDFIYGGRGARFYLFDPVNNIFTGRYILVRSIIGMFTDISIIWLIFSITGIITFIKENKEGSIYPAGLIIGFVAGIIFNSIVSDNLLWGQDEKEIPAQLSSFMILSCFAGRGYLFIKRYGRLSKILLIIGICFTLYYIFQWNNTVRKDINEARHQYNLVCITKSYEDRGCIILSLWSFYKIYSLVHYGDSERFKPPFDNLERVFIPGTTENTKFESMIRDKKSFVVTYGIPSKVVQYLTGYQYTLKIITPGLGLLEYDILLP
ncbi:MAG: hypothetical protein AB1765_01855 [Candidatus Hydrogenedentota bacterium]